jgi:hypothetical protein
VRIAHESIRKINALFRQTEMYRWTSELSNTRVLGTNRKFFVGHSSARGAKFWGVFASRTSEGQGRWLAQGLNRIGWGISMQSGRVEERVRRKCRNVGRKLHRDVPPNEFHTRRLSGAAYRLYHAAERPFGHPPYGPVLFRQYPQIA